MIKIFIIGRLGKDCSTNTVGSNNVINFSVAHSERFKDSMGSFKERTVWAECAYWTDKVGVVPYLKKGVQVYVEGTPDVRIYTTQDGKQGASLLVRVHSVQLLGNKGDAQDGGTSTSQSHFSANSKADDIQGGGSTIDDLPF